MVVAISSGVPFKASAVVAVRSKSCRRLVKMIGDNCKFILKC